MQLTWPAFRSFRLRDYRALVQLLNIPPCPNVSPAPSAVIPALASGLTKTFPIHLSAISVIRFMMPVSVRILTKAAIRVGINLDSMTIRVRVVERHRFTFIEKAGSRADASGIWVREKTRGRKGGA